MAVTVGDILRSALRKINVLESNEPLPASEGADALETFRQMVDGWALETLTIPAVNTVVAPLIEATNAYTIGIYDGPLPVPDNHIEAARPQQILTAFIRDTTNTDYYLEPMTQDTWAIISRKVNESRPSRYYLRKGWPLDTILFDSIPFTTESLHLEVLQPLGDLLPIIGLTETINLPPGYEKGLIYNLCIDLAPEYGKDISPAIALVAEKTKKGIKRSNYRDLVSQIDRAAVTKRNRLGTYIITQGP